MQYITDKNGDSICTGIDGSGCGNILRDHAIHLGAAKRNFEGEEVPQLMLIVFFILPN